MLVQPFTVDVRLTSSDELPQAVINIGGISCVFRPLVGEELDEYHDPQGAFVQRCILCTHPDLDAFRAYYRPDVGSGREEWVFELGDPWISPIWDLGAYTVTITRADGSTVAIEVPKHFWFSRWRWQSAPRPVRTNATQLMSDHLLPWMDPRGLTYGPIQSVPAYAPMALCGIPADQGQTGIYPGIGLITGWQAQYLLRGAPEASFRNQAEASGTVQWHQRDPRTHAPFSLEQYPKATMYSANTGNPYFTWTKTNTKPDSGHHPALAYVPFLLTGDPYCLEELQFTANVFPLAAPSNMRWSNKGRYFAWPARSVGMAVVCTPEQVPSWMLPRSYFTAMLETNRALVMKYMNSTTDPWYDAFHSLWDSGQHTKQDPVPSGDHVWQQNYVGLTVAWLAGLFPEWKPIAEWCIRSQIDRASATSGYMRAYPSPYHIRLRNASVLAEAMDTTQQTLRMQYQDTFSPGETVTVDTETMILRSSVDGLTWTVTRSASPRTHNVDAGVFGKKHVSWTEMMPGNKMTKPTSWQQPPEDTLATATSDITYISNHLAALSAAIDAGLEVPGLVEAHAWLNGEVRRLASARMSVGDNWAMVASPALSLELLWRMGRRQRCRNNNREATR